MNLFKRIPWGTLAAIGTILAILLTAGFFGAWFVLDAIAGQTHSSVGPFENWWQILICVADLVIIPLTVLAYILFSRFREEKKAYNEARGKVPAIFSRSLHGILTGIFVFFYIGFTIGQSLTANNSSFINDFLGIDPYEIVKTDDGEIFNEYVSDFVNEDGSFNDKAMRDNSLSVALQTATEGTVLLSNKDGALPLAKDSNISFFGISSAKYMFIGSGSGHLPVTTTETLAEACGDCGLKVNPKLASAYRMLSGEYGHYTTNLGMTLGGTSIGDRCYIESGIKEVPWSKLDTTSIGNVSSTFSEYGDAAVMIISRNGGEDNEPNFKTSECVDGNYLDLAYEEIEVLDQLMALKANGVFKKVVLLINSANPMQMKHISQYDLDACVWVGFGGNVSYDQIAYVLSGKANPSGKLIDTYAYDNYSAPSSLNIGDFTFATTTGLPATETYAHNDKYVVYSEGIYVGYRYYETRYEDVVLGRANVGNYDYVNTVAYPFGYGLSYTSFEQSGFKVEKVNNGYNVTVTVKNVGDTAGKDVVQVYLQKPYTDYDVENRVEKASVELVGFAKTKQLQPGESQDITVFVKSESFKTYDAYGYGTYIVEAGDYYLSAGLNSHDALNNILAAKGKTTADGMDYNGNASFTELIVVDKLDVDTYSKSTITGYDIVNQFNNADPTLYAGTKDQFKDFRYLTRNDWTGSYPTIAIMDCITQIMVNDLQYAKPVPNNPDLEMPTFGKAGTIKLLDLWGRDYDDPMWDDLLDQITWEEAVSLVTTGGGTGGCVSAGAPGGIAKDGPAGIGVTNETVQQLMCFPSECVMAATFNTELIEALGNAFGMEILHVGYTGIYAPGANIHRSSFSGRNWEYYSEDPYISGKMLASEVRGLQNRGVIVFAKHFALNDQERNRYGVSVWSNEQAIREIYLAAFEGGVVEGDMNGIMSSFNRIGAIWSGKHAGLLTEVLRNEWGFVGVVQTDAYVGTHMHRALAESVVAGNDFTMGGSNPPALDAYRDNTTVAHALRDCAHRILYTQLHSNAMNGLPMDYKIVYHTPWWQTALEMGKTISGYLAIAFGALFLLSWVITLLIRRKIISAIILSVIIIAGIIVGVVFGPAIMDMINPGPEIPSHSCESVCEVCGGCEDADCTDEACATKCSCVKPCDHACATCGLCIDPNSTEARCTEKCGKGYANSQKFEGEDPHVLLYGGTLGPLGTAQEPGSNEAYISGMNANPGASAKFIIVADKAGDANLTASAGKRFVPMAFMTNVMVVVNGEIMSSKGILPGVVEGDLDWVTFVNVNLGCIKLNEGRNVIEFVVTGNECFNFDGITISSDLNLSWYEGEHICDDVCPTCGLCTKEQCTVEICVDKCLCDTDKHEFKVSDTGVVLDGVEVKEGVVEFTSAGQKVKYLIKSTALKSEATVLLNVKSNTADLAISDAFTIKLNGVEVDLSDKVIATDEFVSTKAVIINIPYGHNEIEVVAKSDASVSLAGIVFACDDALSYVDKNEFLASDSHVAVSGLAYKSNEQCIVTHNNAMGSIITFPIYSDKATVADLYLEMATRLNGANLSDIIRVKVNGVEVSTEAGVPTDGIEWISYTAVYIGRVSLNEGHNEISFEVLTNDANLNTNLRAISLQNSDAVFGWSDEGIKNYSLKIEAEKATITPFEYEGRKYPFITSGWSSSNDRYLGGMNDAGIYGPGQARLSFTVNAAAACDAKLYFGAGISGAAVATSYTVFVNGVEYRSEQGWGGDGWYDWTFYFYNLISLNAGDNLIEIRIDSNEPINLDYFILDSLTEISFVETEIGGAEIDGANQYQEEAEKVACNGNIATGGDDQIWRVEDANVSGGFYLGRINEVSQAKPGYYYFKWSITVENDCAVNVYLNAARNGDISVSKAFPIILNGEKVTVNTVLPASDWYTFTTERLATINLKAGENTLYIYVGEGASCNIDYFVFASDATLTFNETVIDSVHRCESKCPVCDKCLDSACTEDACAEKCEGHVTNVYVEEAEKVACNGNIATDGDDQIWRIESALHSGGFYVGHIGDASAANPGYYYFKWSITVANDCTVTIGMNSARNGEINAATAFPAKLNGEDVVFNNVLAASSWTDYNTVILGTVDLKAGENTLYIYIGSGAACNIDYFTFESAETLTFNSTEIDRPAHECESKCPVCDKCLDSACTEDVCAEKCEGHGPETTTVIQEAEQVACNGNVGTGGDDNIWRIEDANRSGNFYLGRIGDVSASNPGYYYFKWSITVANDCTVTIGMNSARNGEINAATAFPAKLNGEDVVFNNVLAASSWTDYNIATLGTVDLKAGENVLYIYIGSGAACNIDYFTFESAETLTFNVTEIDRPAHECESKCPVCDKCLDSACTEDVCAEKCEGHGPETTTVIQEAETVVCNGNVGTGGDDNIWRIEDANRSGNFYLGRINDVSISNPGYYYFKWSITVANDCTVTIGMNSARNGEINAATAFPAKLNGEDVAFANTLPASSWTDYNTATLGTVDLKAGENTLYIYIGSGAACNIDYFTFSSIEELTFNATSIDSAAHSHNLTLIPEVAANCTENGTKAYYTCDGCDKLFADAEGNNEITDPEVILSSGHTEETVLGKDATCVETGLTDGKKCSVCGETLVAQEVIGTKEHSYSDEWTHDENSHWKVCTTNGCDSKSDIDSHNPNMEEPSENEAQICTICNRILAAATGHIKHTYTVLEYDGTHHWYKCVGCELIDGKVEHSFENYVSNNDASCSANGTETSKCSVCPQTHTRTDEDSKKDHTEEILPGKEATATETGLTEGKKCSVCGEILVTREIIPALGYSYIQEAETVVCNGNIATGGDDQIWRNADSNRSGGMYLGRINDVSISNPGYYYFKWSITVANDCTVTIGMNAGRAGDIVAATAFPAKLNGVDIAFANTLPASSWTDYNTATLGTVNLKAGENTLYIYIGSGAACNIDYFTFESAETLTFNATEIDRPAHECESKCPTCGKCLDDACSEDVCADKCEGHGPATTTVIQEAEQIACNGNVATGGDDQIWRIEDANRSGNFYLGRIGDVSASNPGYYYFKWSITVANDCTVTIGMNSARNGEINAATAFPAKLNGEDVVFNNVLAASSWTDYNTAIIGTVDLKAGENVLYIYIGSGAACNIDYFTFESAETLTFNVTEIDRPAHECESVCPTCGKCLDDACSEDVCAEKCEGHGPATTTVIQEAEGVVNNGNKNFGGDDQIWVIGEDGRSGGQRLARINEVSSSNPGYYYFKWSITVANDCEVKIGMNAAYGADINVATAFPIILNGEAISLETIIPGGGWGNYKTESFGTINLKAGENTLYIYIGSGAACDIDYFTFESAETLNFNSTTID